MKVTKVQIGRERRCVIGKQVAAGVRDALGGGHRKVGDFGGRAGRHVRQGAMHS